nr:metal ABC transporter substrate-binding protein [Phytoactinopolyspora mesophila]
MVLAGCGGGAAASGDDDGRPTVMTTFTVLADITRNVGGDAVVVESITKPGAEIHGYEPTPGDIRRVSDADLILENGLGLELWFDDFMARVDAPRVVVSEGVEVMAIQSGNYAGDANPHAWMSPLETIVYVENIAEALSELDPDNAELFDANATAYAEELRDAHDELVAAVAGLPEHQRALVTCEGAFSYLARDAGLAEAYLWPVNSDADPTPRHLADTIDLVRDNEIPAVFCESTISDDLAEQVARQSGAQYGGVLYVDSLSEPDGPVPTYLDLIRHDIDTIIAGLTDEAGQGR